MMNLTLLDTAKQKYINGEENLAEAFYKRAIEEGVPSDVINIRKITREYLLFPLDFVEASEYFMLLFKLKKLAKADELTAEYVKALESLLNFKKMFLREISMYYFSELAVCYGNSLIVKHIFELYEYITQNLESIADNDCYEIKYYIPNADMKKLKTDFLKVKAFCLNILLSYSAAQDSAYAGTTYQAYTYDYGWYSSTQVTSTDNYINWAVIKPRLNMIGLEAYYDEYLTEYKKTIKEVNRYVSFDSPKELRNEIRKLSEYRRSKDNTDKEFYKIAKRFEKNDVSRDSLVKTFAKFNYLYWITGGRAFRFDQVGSFELDTYFTRKKIWGVCDMISCGTHWSLDTVRWLMLGLIAFGGPVYLILGIAMKFGFYLPSVTVEKH